MFTRQNYTHLCETFHGCDELPLFLQSPPLSLTGVHPLCQSRELPQGLLERGVIRMPHRRVFEQVLDEENVARYSLDWLYEKIIECETTFAVFGSLLQVNGEISTEITCDTQVK